jgi:uncharacterized protein (PEP-CTERM system associated)
VGGLAAQFAPSLAQAQKAQLDLSLETQVSATSNAGLQSGAAAKGDLVLDLHPRARFRSKGGGLDLDVTFGAIGRHYLRGTQNGRFEPEVEGRGRAEVVEGWVALDGSVSVTPATSDPFTGRAQSAADISPTAFSSRRAHLTPRVERDLNAQWQLRAHSDHGWQRSDDPNGSPAVRATTHTEDTVVRVQRLPVPLGASVEWRRQRQDNPTAPRDGTVLAIDSVRVGAAYQVASQLVAGVTAGRERSAYLTREDTDSIVGFSLEWQPHERAWLRGTTERRFFGQAFDVAAAYRSPYMAFSASFSRQPGLLNDSLGTGVAGADVVSLLDSLLTTRIPNPVERAAAVDRLVQERGLPAQLPQATELVDQTPQLVRNGQVSMVMLGVRHSVALGLYSRSAQELKREDDLNLGLSPSDFRQRGATAILSRRLTPTMTLGLEVARSATRGQGASSGDYLNEWRVRTDLSIAVSSRTRLSVGLGRQLVESNRAGNYGESRALVGLMQNF